ncbi:unnamed protein product [Schistosoma margrebowiei]|uniref:Uncharacterized protein n=1 Tax=Schistosoma margrebowiei TaxID=48269 RepID=A0A183NBB4_9TREM|nr:unnamed protein product [Schistosoma margrebowiei]
MGTSILREQMAYEPIVSHRLTWDCISLRCSTALWIRPSGRRIGSLGLESSKSNQIVDQIQKNMDNVVNTDTTAYESQLDFDKKTTCLTPQRGIDSPISEIMDHNESPTNPECSGDDSNQSQNVDQPQYSFLPTVNTVTYELRRRELLRANQRIALNPSYSLNNSTEDLTGHINYHQSMASSLSSQLPSSECRAICIPDNNHSLYYFNPNSNTTMSLSDSVLRYCVPEKSNTDETNANSHSLSCPCGNPQSCPLSEQKIERLVSFFRILVLRICIFPLLMLRIAIGWSLLTFVRAEWIVTIILLSPRCVQWL